MSKGFSGYADRDVQAAIKDLRKFVKDLETVPTEELTKSAEVIKANAVAQAPYETGRLEKSIYVKVSRDKYRPGLFAGARVYSKHGYDYAGIQHHDMTFHHPIKGKAHYISDPFNEEIANLKRRLRNRLKVK